MSEPHAISKADIDGLLSDDGTVNLTEIRRRQAPKTANDGNGMSRSVCGNVRQKLRDGSDFEDLADKTGYSKNTIKHHANGGCSHGGDDHPPALEYGWHETDGVESSGSSYRPKAPNTTADGCREIRQRLLNGDAVGKIASDLKMGTHTVRRHARGECWHDIEATAPLKYGWHTPANPEDVGL